MKTINRAVSVAILAFSACIAFNHASAQIQLAGWNTETPVALASGGGAAPAPFAATSYATNLVTAGNLTKGTNPGPAVVTTGGVYGGNAWTNASFLDNEGDSITNGLYIEYSVTADAGYVISFTENFLNYHNSATGPTNGALQYCTDGVSYSNIAYISYAPPGTAETATNIVNLATNAFLQNIPAGTTNFFRIVNWGATGAAGTWYVDDTVATNAGLQLLGTVAPAPSQLVGWNVNGITTNTGGAGGPPPALFAATTYATNLVIPGNLSKGTNAPGFGVVTTGTAEYGGNNWYTTNESETNSIAEGFFIEYSVTAAPGSLISFSENFLNYHNSATGPTNGALQYCTDGVSYSNIALISYAAYDTAATSTNIINLSTNVFLQNVPAGVTNYFRIVNWGTDGTGTSGTWYIYNTVPTNAGLQLLGTVQSELAGWNVSPATNGGGAAPAPWPATVVAANATAGNLTKGTNPGPSLITTGGVYGGNDWYTTNESETNSIAEGYYIEYSVASVPGYTISFSENYLNYHNSATGPTNGALQYCTDGVSYSNIALISYAPYDTAETLTNIINLSTNAFLQNIPSSVTNYFRIVNWGTVGTGTAGTWYVEGTGGAASPGLQLIGTLSSGGLVVAPTNLVVSPSSATANAGATVEFTVTANGFLPSYAWYSIISGVTNPIANATTPTLTLTNVLGGNSGSYFVVLSNAIGMATSSVVSLTVVDPFVVFPPNNAMGFYRGQVQFSVSVAGASPSLFWYQNNGTGPWTLITNGVQPSGSTVLGQGTTALTITNLQYADSNNFAFIEVVVSDSYGTNTSPAVSLLSVSSNPATLASYVFNGDGEVLGVQDGLPNSGILAQWDFNGANYTNAQLNPAPWTGVVNPVAPAIFFPPPWIGVGTATAVGCAFAPTGGPSGISPFNGALAAGVDGAGYTTNIPNGSFGTENYPLAGSNKLNGVQFMTSTVGAKNINISYYLRETGTSSEYTRLQYTTNNGVNWTDYPASSSFPGSDVNLYAPIYTYNLSGFPGVANNPEFGIQIVTEYQSTATYGIGSQGGNPLYITNGYVGADNLYSSGGSATTSAGTLTFDLVTIAGSPMDEAIYSPPTISPITNANATNAINTLTLNSVAEGQSNYDFVVITNTFTIGSAISPVKGLALSAQSLNPSKVFLNYSFTIVGSNVTMVMTPNGIPDPLDAAPIMVTVTDTNSGDSVQSWFLLTLQSLNLPPTNSLTSVTLTNMLANSTLSIPFYVGSYDGSNSVLTYSSNSLNNAVIPTANLGLTGEGTTNLIFSITPAHNQLGQGVVSATVYDNNPTEPRFTTATFPIMVRPNTNIILIDYFNYDSSGPLETVSDGFWGHLTGNENQVQVGNGLVPNSVTIDSVDFTETLQGPLLGAPYYVNSAASNTAPVLYTSCIVTVDTLPVASGGYITAFNDGSGNAGGSVNRLECGLWVETNTAATPNHYQLGIGNYPSQQGSPGATFPRDLSVGTSYVVVTALNVSSGVSTLWVDPINQSSPSVTDTTTAAGVEATNVNVYNFTLHEGTGGGVAPTSLSTLKVGTTFDAVFPSLHLQEAGPNVIVTWSDPTLGIQTTSNLLSPWVDLTNATSPYTNAVGTNAQQYFKFGR